VKPDRCYQTPSWMAIRAIRAKLTAADLYLWMYLQMIDPSGDRLTDIPHPQDIAAAIGISERQVKWSIAKLEKEGLYHYQLDPWKGQNLSGLEAKKLGEESLQPQNYQPTETTALPTQESWENSIRNRSIAETIETVPQVNISVIEQQQNTTGTLSKIAGNESRLAARGKLPPWRIKHGVNGINLEFAEWLRQKQMHKFKREIPLFDTLGWIMNREAGGKYFTSEGELIAAVTEWQQSKIEWDAPSPGQLLASEVGIALNSPVAGGVVDRFKKTAGKYDWEIAPGEPVPEILEWYAKQIQYSKRPEFAGKPPMALARQDFCDRFLAAGIYEEYQKWAKSVIRNHHTKVQTLCSQQHPSATATHQPDAKDMTIEVASRPTGTVVNRIKAYISQAHVSVLRKSLQDTINTALKASDISLSEKIAAFQLILDNQHLHDWAIQQAEFHGLEIVDEKVEVAF